MLSDKQGLEWLSMKLKTLSDSGFRQSQLYKLLRDELTARNHWKKQPRGNPKKGYRGMQDQQQDDN